MSSDDPADVRCYEVTAIGPETPPGRADTLEIDHCANEQEARERALAQPDVDEVIEVQEWADYVELEIRGTKDQVASVLEDVARVTERAAAEVRSRDPRAGAIELDTGDEDTRRVAVADWRDAEMEIIGLADDFSGEGDGIAVGAHNFAAEDAVVEFRAGDKTLAKVVLQDDE